MEKQKTAAKELVVKYVGHRRASRIYEIILGVVEKFRIARLNNPLQSWRLFAANLRGLSGFRLFSSGLSVPTNGKYFLTFKLRPVAKTGPHNLWKTLDSSNSAIVLQGPIETNRNFTLETVKLYRRNFPNATIVVSTWVGTHKEIVKNLEHEGAIVLLNNPPDAKGIGNSNLQMISSYLGLSEVKRMGILFALKTRTDQRFYNPLLLNLLKSMQQTFPLHVDSSGTQKERIVTMSFGSFAYRLYGLTDMMQFGHIDDLLSYWSGKIDSRDISTIEAIDSSTPMGFARQNIAECYFCSTFLEITKWPLKWSLEDYWNSVSARFCVVDAQSLDLLWPKYSAREDRWRSYDESLSNQEIDFSFWLSLPSFPLPKEEILNTKYSFLGNVPDREAPV